MSASGGKDLLLQYNTTGSTYVTVGGLRTKSMTLNNEPIDVTNHGSNQFREILASAGIRSLSMSGSGVYTGDSATLQAIEAAALAGTLVSFQMVDDNNSRTYEADFKVVSFEWSGEYNTEMTYSISLESSGTITVS